MIEFQVFFRRLTQKWDEAAHPRDPAGTATGGQFTSAGGPVIAESGLDPAQGELFPRSRQDLLEVAAKRGREAVGEIAQQLIAEEKTLSGGSWDTLSEEQQQDTQNEYENDHLQELLAQQREEWAQGERDNQEQAISEDEDFQTKWLQDVAGISEADARGYVAENDFLGLSNADLATRLERHIGYLKAELPAGQTLDQSLLDAPAKVRASDASFDAAVAEAVDSYMEANPPSERLNEEWVQNAVDQAGEDFAQLSDEEKFELSGESTTVTAEEPEQWGVDSDTLDEQEANMVRALGNELATQRSLDIAKARGLTDVTAAHFEDLRDKLWSAWKGSSTSDGGLALQYLSELELGSWSRLSGSQRESARAWLKGMTQDLLGQLGETSQSDLEQRSEALGRAYVRGLWETTQYLMSQSGVNSVDLYRGLIRPADEVDPEPFEPVPVDIDRPREHPHGGYVRLPELRLKQGSASSWTSKRSVANSWNGVGPPPPNPVRVVVRAKVPPTAVLAVPVFGVNLHHESEYVVLGTPWHHWDAWRDEAPRAEQVAIKAADERPMDVPDKDGIREQTGAKKKGLVIDITEDDGWLKEPPKKPDKTQKGSATSGNYGHAGRPGEVGGSAPSGTSSAPARSTPLPTKRKWIEHGVYTEGPLKGQPLPQDTLEAHQNSATRSKLHEQIIDELLSAAPANQEQPHAIILVGGFGAGKSTLIQASNIPPDYVMADADKIKEKIPEYQQALHQPDGYSARDGAMIVHEESSSVWKELQQRAVDTRRNIVIDGSGKNLGLYLDLMQHMRAKGYRITLIKADVDLETGIQRVKDRAETTGRMVPLGAMEAVYQSVDKNFPIFSTLADEALLYDNRGETPKLMYRKKGTREMIVDPVRYEAYRKRHHAA